MSTATAKSSPIDAEALGKNLRVLRLAEGLTAVSLAEKIGYTKADILDWEGGRRLPSPAAVNDLSMFFGAWPEDVLPEPIPPDAVDYILQGEVSWPWEPRKRWRGKTRGKAAKAVTTETARRPLEVGPVWRTHHAKDEPRDPTRPVSRVPTLMTQKELDEVERIHSEHLRPVTRGDCRHVPRPCPWVGCRWHLYLDVTEAGSVKLNFPHLEPWEMTYSCVLDEADKGGLILEECGERLNVTRERVRQIEEKNLRALRQLGDYLNQ